MTKLMLREVMAVYEIDHQGYVYRFFDSGASCTVQRSIQPQKTKVGFKRPEPLWTQLDCVQHPVFQNGTFVWKTFAGSTMVYTFPSKEDAEQELLKS
jgi:hypothetical protein